MSDPKAQPAIPGAGPADEAAKAIPPTPTPSPVIAAAPALTVVAEPQPAPLETDATPASQSADKEGEARKASDPSASPSVVAAPQPVPSETKDEPANRNTSQDGDAARALGPAPTPSMAAAPETQDRPADPAGDAGKAPPPPTAASVAANDAAAKPPAAPAPTSAGAAPTGTAPQVATANEGAPPQEAAQVLIVMARPDVKDVADLRDKSVLVDGAPTISNAQLQASFAAAGASGAEFKHSDKNGIERFVRGEFAAAVVGVVTPGLASYTREVPGFRLLHVQVSPLAKP